MIDAVMKMIAELQEEGPLVGNDPGDIPDFLLVKNRKPLTPEQQAKLDAVCKQNPSREEEWQRRERLRRLEIDRAKALKEELARPAKEEFFARKKAEAAEIKAVKDAAKAAKGKVT